MLNNYSAIHLVNNKDLLIPSTFVLFKDNNIVQVSSSSLPILRYREKVLKKVLNSLNSKNIIDLKLKNIIVIKGFYINIILMVLLHAISI